MPVSTPALLAALEWAADAIKAQDGGDMATETGWKSDEALEHWLTIKSLMEIDMTNPTTPFDRALEQFKRDMKWSPEATETEKMLVLGNLNGFVSLLNRMLLETHDREILAAVSPEDLAKGHEALRRARQSPRLDR